MPLTFSLSRRGTSRLAVYAATTSGMINQEDTLGKPSAIKREVRQNDGMESVKRASEVALY